MRGVLVDGRLIVLARAPLQKKQQDICNCRVVIWFGV